MDDKFNNPYAGFNNMPQENFIPPAEENPEHKVNDINEVGSSSEPIISDLFDAPKAPAFSNNMNESFVDSQVSSQPQTSVNEQNNTPYACEWHGDSVAPSVARTVPPYTSPYSPHVNTQPKREKKSKGVSRGGFIAGIAICLCLSFVAGFVGTGVFNYVDSLNQEIKNGLTINRVDSDKVDSAYKDGGLSTVEIVEKSADCVVEITTETVKTGIFAQQFIDSGAGSGVVVDKDGMIVTNHHVIDGATKISVSLRDGTSYDATLVGSDAELDIALLSVEPKESLSAAVFGDSDKLRVGERTVAIGNPLGQLGGSVTEGILSALNRDVVIDGQTMSLLQTDTAINPGNSGGGLFDSYGNLIGIVNAKSSGSEIEGLGFAIPINDVINVIGDLSEYGYVRGRVDLGITFIDVDSEQLAWMYGLKETGCYIYSVEAGTNASKAGFKSGDKVIYVNSKEINSSDDVEDIIDGCRVGEEVEFTVKTTSGKTQNITLTLEEYIPQSSEENFFQNNNPDRDYSMWWSDYN